MATNSTSRARCISLTKAAAASEQVTSRCSSFFDEKILVKSCVCVFLFYVFTHICFFWDNPSKVVDFSRVFGDVHWSRREVLSQVQGFCLWKHPLCLCRYPPKNIISLKPGILPRTPNTNRTPLLQKRPLSRDKEDHLDIKARKTVQTQHQTMLCFAVTC